MESSLNPSSPPQADDPQAVSRAAANLRAAVDRARRGMVDRDVLVELLALAAVAGEHLLIIGPPGTAKSAVARAMAEALGGRYFEYLLGRFTEPSELFGPVDLRKLQEGKVETAVDGMLPEAEIAFLDEVFKGSTAILNTLLGLLNERVFRRGHSVMRCPLRLAVGASNALPDDPSLAAFADRFLLRCWVEPVADPQLERLLAEGWNVETRADDGPPPASLADLDLLSRTAARVDLEPVRPLIARALRTLRGAGIELSDRRAVKCQRLVAAAAVLDGRFQADGRDLWPLVAAVPEVEDQKQAQVVLQPLMEGADNRTLSRAAELSGRGAAARERLLLEAGRELLGERFEGEPPRDEDGQVETGRRLALEGLAREIDVGFAEASRSPELGALYGRLTELLTDEA